MAGLRLIKTYSSDSDEDKHDEKEKNNDVKIADRSRLALPESILSWKGVLYNEEVIDDPLNHDGRIRSFKYERGNWATLIYVNYTANDCLRAWMNSILRELSIKGNIIPNLHISLSRTLVLKFHWIESFVESLKLLCCGFSRFTVELTDLKVYCNEERTRTFLGICCQNNDGTLKLLTESLDNLLAEYQLPSFYEDTSYHISFFWCLGDKQAYLKNVLSSLLHNLNKYLKENIEDKYIHVKEIHCKIGNKFYTFELK